MYENNIIHNLLSQNKSSLNEIMTVIIVGQNSHEMGDQALKSMKIIRFYDH